ncbi:hypothetical protein RIVM261_024850 [Rivularia sp. IAM M-261]|nr:hypothetical protein RIVM261_024850 [Rivularia sp. IAM M-261]
MSQVVLLDSDPLGMVTNPKASSIEVQECKLWFNTLSQRNYTVMLPEITDYEVRRELLRVGKIKSIRRLDRLKLQIPCLSLTTETILLAAQLWPEARLRGRPTVEPSALDGDVILAAQAILIENEGLTTVAEIPRYSYT